MKCSPWVFLLSLAVMAPVHVVLAKDSPAQVEGVKALHHAGQTFITWSDVVDDFGDKPVTYGQIRQRKNALSYRVYRAAKPIDSGNLKNAGLVEEVAPLSAFNVNGWSLERLVNQALFLDKQEGELAKRGPFSGWNINSPEAARLVIPRLAIEDGKPLPPGTGLCVYSANADGTAYYAVTAVEDGVENTQVSAANSPAQPVEEKAQPWLPVEQSDTRKFAFDFRGTRHYFVTWVAPPLAPQPMYFNWSVLVPPDSKGVADVPSRPVELYFHTPGLSYARPPTKLFNASIQICPHDFPFSGWYGYNDALLTGGKAEGGVVRPYTIKRIEAFLKWAAGRYRADMTRVAAVGGDGAAMMALHRPELCSVVFVTRFQTAQLDAKLAGDFEKCWGPAGPQIKDEAGRSNWSWGEFDTLLCGRPMPSVVKDENRAAVQPNPAYPGARLPLPMFVCNGGSWGRDLAYGRGRGRLYYALQACRQGLLGDWQWGGHLAVPNKYEGTWRGVDFTCHTPFPALTFSTADKEGETSGQCNLGYSWSGVKEEADSFEATISGPAGSFDLTPRRPEKFKLAPGQKLDWEAVATTVPRGAKEPLKQAGQATADANGLVTLTGVQLSKESPLKIRIARAKQE